MQLTASQFFTRLKEPDLCSELPLAAWADFILVLRETKLLASFGHRAQLMGCYNRFPDYAQHHIDSAIVYARRQRQQILYEAEQLRSQLQGDKFDFFLLKGAAYAVAGLACAQGRLVSDIDVLVDKDDLLAVEKSLKSALWQSEKLSDYDEKYYRQWAHELPPLYHPLRGTVLDVHHNIFMAISRKKPNIEGFTANAEMTESGCMVFGNAQMVLHSCIHLFANEDLTSSSRDLWDLYQLTQEFDDETFWSSLVALAKSSGFEQELYFSLKTLSHYFHIALNAQVYAFLQEVGKSSVNQFWEGQYRQAVIPNHPNMARHFAISMARFLTFLRGHYLKMPLPKLVKHLSVKTYLSCYKLLFGRFSLN